MACDLPPDEVQAVRYGGILHDIGKIGISEAILLKPGPLDENEILQIRQHPEIGARIISQMRFAPEVGPIILGHHERWDAKGYPQGLRGEAVPVGARIISIVDAYDAMTTDRPYRRALMLDEVLQRLRKDRGTQFDPNILDVFLDLLVSERLVAPEDD
jgi:putative two-component system response regulator